MLWLNAASDILISRFLLRDSIPAVLFCPQTPRHSLQWDLRRFRYVHSGLRNTHLMGAVTIWHPIYRLDGVIKAITAVASAATFIMLVPMMPTLIALPSPVPTGESEPLAGA